MAQSGFRGLLRSQEEPTRGDLAEVAADQVQAPEVIVEGLCMTTF